ncbi:MAG: aspartate--tRNA ligase [Bacillota bacterium]|nr:aspartate--tRNA ligase [Bacillota bacterium]
MTESFKGTKRTGYCTDYNIKNLKETVTVCGFVQKMRNLGGLIFIDLRDRSGIIQCVFDEADNDALFKKAEPIRSEYVLAVTGTIRARAEGMANKKMATGEIEVLATSLKILSVAETTPFEIVENSKVNDDLRLRYRYLDLRRPDLQANIIKRSHAAKIIHDYFNENGFLEIETPTLIKSTPEGARDYLVPSRLQHGHFYALPQSPQLYKQLLMLAGMDRYIQIAHCFRDEDLRADRQPEFTQIDMELSFVEIDDIIEINEGFLKRLWKELMGVDIVTPFPRITYKDAMERYGSDKPDTRFGFELRNISETVRNCGFKVFKDAVENGGSVRGINVKQGAGKFSRKEIDSLGEFVKTYKAKGLAWVKMGDETTSSFLKFMTEEEGKALINALDGEKGDLLLIVADKDSVTFDALGALRCEVAKRLNILKKDDYRFLWVVEFPMLEYSEEEGRFTAKHHPFTAPMDEDVGLIESDPAAVRAKAYDIVLNGTELGGGSLRIYNSDLQARMFKAIGFTEEEARAKFGFFIDAFKYGTPPHGGLAYGFDRLMMYICGEDTIRDVMAFPKVQNASEPMSGCPDIVDEKQLEELGIAIKD